MIVSRIITPLLSQPKVGALPLSDKEKMLKAIVHEVYALKNVELGDEREMMEAQTIENNLSHSFAFLTMGEVSLAAKRGIMGEFNGCNTSPNAANFLGWVSAYAKSADRADAVTIYEQEEARREYARRAERIANEAAQKNADYYANEPEAAFQTYRQQGRAGFLFAQYVATVYDALWHQGKLRNVTQETLAAATASAKKSMIEKLGHKYFSMKGANAVTEQTYLKQELVFAYFDANIKQGKVTLKHQA